MRTSFLAFSMVMTIGLAAFACQADARRSSPSQTAGLAPAAPRARATRAVYFTELDSLVAAVTALRATAKGTGTSAQAVEAFRVARRHYKRIEALAEYYSPVTARAMNGPVLDRAEPDDPAVVILPSGFQVMEEALFPAAAPDWAEVVAREGALMDRHIALLRRGATETEPTDGHIFDALRLELARSVILGLAGFDAPLSGDGIREAATTFRGVAALTDAYRATGDQSTTLAAWDSLRTKLTAAADYLDAHPDFERFDRLTFIAAYANPASRALDALRREQRVTLPSASRAWSAGAPTVFERDAFDAHAYAPTYAPASTPALVDLGRDLFFDTILSDDGDRSCAFCHLPHRSFTDGLPRRKAVIGLQAAELSSTGRNTPTLVNVGLQPASFFDQRTTYLEDQVTDVITNRAEMGRSIVEIAARVRRTRDYKARFNAVFGASVDSAVTPLRLRMALATYLRSLQALDSRVDLALRGDTAALTSAERAGFTVFMGKGKCATCHFLPLFNGVTPPTFTEAEPEVIGVPAERVARKAVIDDDLGQFAIDRIGFHRHAFKTPTLRNIALTAPYMHNGAFETLEQVVDFYDVGGGVGLGIELDNQTLPPDSLHLTRAEKRDLVAFLHALSDTVSVPTLGSAGAKIALGSHSVR